MNDNTENLSKQNRIEGRVNLDILRYLNAVGRDGTSYSRICMKCNVNRDRGLEKLKALSSKGWVEHIENPSPGIKHAFKITEEGINQVKKMDEELKNISHETKKFLGLE